MRRVIIVGNGFIYHLNDLIQAEKTKFEKINNLIGRNGAKNCGQVIGELGRVSNLFNHFDKLQSELKNFFSDKVQYEELFEKLDALLDWYRDKNKFKNVIDDKCFDGLEKLVEKIISEKIAPVIKEFEEQELGHAYGDLSRLFNGATVGDRVFSEQQVSHDKIGVFTTNYDGFLVQLLRRSVRENGGFHFTDGFGGGRYGKPVVPFEPYFSDSNFIAHLHSSYRIGYKNDELIKTKLKDEGERNTMPILVYMNPGKKLEYIMRHYILRRYWDTFKYWVNDASEIVIYGNSLRSDPHIVDLINRAGKRVKNKPTIYAAGRNPSDVLARLTFPVGAIPTLRHIDTQTVGLDRLHEIFTTPEAIATIP
jgi:hypothetical protein